MDDQQQNDSVDGQQGNDDTPVVNNGDEPEVTEMPDDSQNTDVGIAGNSKQQCAPIPEERSPSQFSSSMCRTKQCKFGLDLCAHSSFYTAFINDTIGAREINQIE